MARLYAKCNVPRSHVQGKIGWNLSYQNPLEQHYERYSYTNQNNVTKAELTVYSTSDSIPGSSKHFNISNSKSFKYVLSSNGFSNASQTCLGLFKNTNLIDTRIDNLYNASGDVLGLPATISSTR